MRQGRNPVPGSLYQSPQPAKSGIEPPPAQQAAPEKANAALVANDADIGPLQSDPIAHLPSTMFRPALTDQHSTAQQHAPEAVFHSRILRQGRQSAAIIAGGAASAEARARWTCPANRMMP